MSNSTLLLRFTLSGLFSLLLIACGGGGGGDDPVMLSDQAVIFPTQSHTIYFENAVPTLMPNSLLIVGDHSGNGAMRTLVQFSLPTLPDGAVVTSAVLNVYGVEAIGAPQDLGDLMADHVNWPLAVPLSTSYGTGHTIGVGNLGAFQSPKWLQINAPWRRYLDVSPSVAQDVALQRDTSSFRIYLQIPTDSDFVQDARKLAGYHTDSAETYDVKLTITYEFPQP